MKNNIKKKIGYGIGYTLAVLIAAICFFPIIWMFFSAFKDATEVTRIPAKLLPDKWISSNFKIALNDGLFKAMIATFVSGMTASLCAVVVNSMAGYVFARMEFHGKKFLWVYCLMTMFIPGITINLTSYIMVYKLGLTNTFWVLVLPGLAGGYSIFFWRQFFLGIPMSFEDAARIDGCGRFQIYARIFLPILKGPLAISIASFFFGHWNSYMWPTLTITVGNRWTQVQQIIRSYTSSYGGGNYGVIMAASLLAIIPPIIVFAIFQKHITRGYIMSGLK